MRELLRNIAEVSRLLPGSVRIHEPLAEGGQGIVYRGVVSDRAAAIKIYFPGQLAQRVEREVEALRAIDSPVIVRLLWNGHVSILENELPVVATSFLEGTALETLQRDRPLTHDSLGRLAFDVASAVDQIWARRIVHRDLKPSNIMMTPSGRACVIDLGLARHVDRSSLTIIGATWGTYGYLSPEQTQGTRQLTCKSDMFALGVILVEAALGRHPTLPTGIADWRHAGLVKSLLHPRPTKRPKPAAVLDLLSDYAP
jgi:eukaryotic-like serine/threonine-protein kinase